MLARSMLEQIADSKDAGSIDYLSRDLARSTAVDRQTHCHPRVLVDCVVYRGERWLKCRRLHRDFSITVSTQGRLDRVGALSVVSRRVHLV